MAATLELPGSALKTLETVEAPTSYSLPTGPFDDGDMPFQVVEGEVTRQAWRIDTNGLTTLQLLIPLRAQLLANGYQVIFSCNTDDCGGFDFRYGMDVVREPKMHVDLGDFRYLAVQKTDDGIEHLGLLVSKSATAGFIQIVQIVPVGSERSLQTTVQLDPQAQTDPRVTEPNVDDGPLAETLETRGRVVLFDLSFETGSSELGDGDFPSLGAIADYLAQNPNRTIAVVGHTDSQGSLENNIALSKRRAASVLNRLVDSYDVSPNQLEAEGMGYLSPLTSNLSEVGRQLNRRVEVIITSTE